MRKRYKTLFIIGILVIIGTAGYVPFHKWARKHTNWATAVEDHPTNCFSCHLYTVKSGPVAKLINADYLSPFNLAISKDGSRLFVVAEEANSLFVIDTRNKKILHRIMVGKMPHSVVLSHDEKTAFVSNQWADYISLINLDSFTERRQLKTGNGPAGLALSNDERYLYAVNSYSNDISVFDLQTGQEISRPSAGNNPTGINLSPDGRTAYVTSRRAILAPYGTPVITELTRLNTEVNRVTEHRKIESAYMMENVAFTPDGELAIFPLIRPKNLVPSIQVERGWMMTNGIGIVEEKPEGRTIQLLFDEPNVYYADPFDIAVTPDGHKAFVSNAGVDCITVINIDSLKSIISETPDDLLRIYANHLGISCRFVTKRIHTGANPKGITLSPDGKLLYVAEHLDDKIAVINTETLEVADRIDLKGPRRVTVARLGRRMLNNAGHTFQTQYSCYTCHPDTHEDGLVYNMASKDMGRNLANTQTLRSVGEIPPYKWNGKNQTLYKQDGMRFSTVLTRTEPFSYKELDALVAYITAGVRNPPNLMYNPDGHLKPAQLRGKKIFERTHDLYGNEIPVTNRCVTCHPAPHYTNKMMTDVGTLAASDDSILFDTPHLNNIFSSAPYLHDGRATTLEEIWTIYGKEELHGALNDLTKIDLNDLIEYLKSLRDPEYDENVNKTMKASVLNH
jgi:YVTN family beta-propeller protein